MENTNITPEPITKPKTKSTTKTTKSKAKTTKTTTKSKAAKTSKKPTKPAVSKFVRKIGFVSLGCDKNRVDTENIMTNLVNHGFEIVGNPAEAHVIIINTCAFLLKAREEATNTILEMAQYKIDNLEKIIVIGCLPMSEEGLEADFPEVDAFVKGEDYDKIPDIIFNLYNHKPNPKEEIVKARLLTTPKHVAYLKISDGCDNFCTYCKIPYIRGRYTSTPIEKLVAEATALANKGVKELILVAQDVTRYGVDLYHDKKLVDLLQALSKVEGIEWIRLHYCYPELIDDQLIKEIKTNKKIVKYLDIPMQHASSKILRAMNRKSDENSLSKLVNTLRKEIPGIVIRSTFMVGFPGETREDFKILLNFLKEFQLDNVGFFAYSREEGTVSYGMRKQICGIVKHARLRKVQRLQTAIAYNLNKANIDKTFRVICDGYDVRNNIYLGRSYMSSPDVDYYIYFHSTEPVGQGDFVDVRIIDVNKDYLLGVKQ